jgi:hypothetical protein
MRMSLKEYEAMTGEKKPKQNKYRAIPCEVDGFRFDSKAEALYYKILIQMVKYQQVAYFLRQVPFHIPGNTKLVVDFMVVAKADDSTWIKPIYLDVKGDKPTYAWTVKRKAVEALYPVTIDIVQKKEVNVLARQYGVS